LPENGLGDSGKPIKMCDRRIGEWRVITFTLNTFFTPSPALRAVVKRENLKEGDGKRENMLRIAWFVFRNCMLPFFAARDTPKTGLRLLTLFFARRNSS
jgi:flagella basal body P-ring formation protein FlgA